MSCLCMSSAIGRPEMVGTLLLHSAYCHHLIYIEPTFYHGLDIPPSRESSVGGMVFMLTKTMTLDNI